MWLKCTRKREFESIMTQYAGAKTQKTVSGCIIARNQQVGLLLTDFVEHSTVFDRKYLLTPDAFVSSLYGIFTNALVR